jgi:hypothetical protein
MNCPNCGSANLPGARFCASCGAALPAAAPQPAGGGGGLNTTSLLIGALAAGLVAAIAVIVVLATAGGDDKGGAGALAATATPAATATATPAPTATPLPTEAPPPTEPPPTEPPPPPAATPRPPAQPTTPPPPPPPPPPAGPTEEELAYVRRATAIVVARAANLDVFFQTPLASRTLGAAFTEFTVGLAAQLRGFANDLNGITPVPQKYRAAHNNLIGSLITLTRSLDEWNQGLINTEARFIEWLARTDRQMDAVDVTLDQYLEVTGIVVPNFEGLR